MAGRVEAGVAGCLVCALPEGKTASGNLAVSLTSKAPFAAEEPAGTEAGPAAAGETGPVLMSGIIRAVTTNGVVVAPDMAGACPAKGYVCAVQDKAQHPKTGEIMAFWPGPSLACEFLQAEGTVTCRLPAGTESSLATNQSVLISSQPLAPNRKVEVEGRTLQSGKLVRTGRARFLETVSGKWKERQGRYVSVPAGPEEVPVLATSEALSGSVQFDFDLMVEKQGATQEEDGIRDLMIEVYCPARRTALTFGIGSGREKNVVVTGQTIQLAKGERVMKKPAGLPPAVKVKAEVVCAKGSSLIKMDREYGVRIRRVGGVVALYLNGKRAAHVAYPDLEGDLHFRLAAPGGTISLGKMTVRELPPSCRIPDEEPPLGEFGYVLWADSSQILIDSDLSGAAANRKVTIVAIDKVVQGEASRSVLMKPVAEAMIAEVGPRISRAVRVGSGEPVEKGMKVFVGVLPPSPVFTESRLSDVDQGL
jgi:hypothetical protein